MPKNFRYRDAFLKGRPRHEKYDAFWMKHPPMDIGHRAKIFAPFAALKGYDTAVASKEVLYEDRSDLDKDDPEALEHKLQILHNLTFNSRMARENHVKVSVTYYEPCKDVNHEDYGIRGQSHIVSGICWNVDIEVSRTITIDRTRISLDNVLKISGSDDLFKEDWMIWEDA